MVIEQSDALLKSLLKDEDKAYILLYEHYYTPLVLFAMKYIQDEDIAKDLVQELFVSMLGQQKVFTHIAALKVYLYSSVRNRAINHLRHQKIEGRYEAKLLEEGEDADLFWERVMEEDLFSCLLDAVEHLSPQWRRVILLTLKGYKISEVAEQMNISLETAKEYKKAGKKKLAQQFKDGSYIVLISCLLS